jgi:hypothetical protein
MLLGTILYFNQTSIKKGNSNFFSPLREQTNKNLKLKKGGFSVILPVFYLPIQTQTHFYSYKRYPNCLYAAYTIYLCPNVNGGVKTKQPALFPYLQ